MNRLENQTLALAGMLQAVVLIDELANIGTCNDGAFEGSFKSLFMFDAATPEQVFGDIACLGSGFAALDDYLGGRSQGSSRNIAYYLLSMMKLAVTLMRDDMLSVKLFDGLSEIERRSQEFAMSRASVVNKIDGLYQDTISHLNPRIMVRGDQSYLLNDATAAKIRTLLLAGIRSAVLWRQLGGNNWKLFLRRKKYLALARQLSRRH
ncbi:MAG: high frequency lysogenization protein HflD [Gammaproteobacteria bacterium]|nr:high frequency lysogenization protein HflD [Gammaproteobacteria bacterium]MDH3447477.1 high frequency lysogenization protein HflD [Gammaproteobacteria bacterium]